MKKALALIAAALFSTAPAASFSASASSTDDGYCPKLYFSAHKSDDFEILHSGRVFYNVSAAKSDVPTIVVDAYVSDEKKSVSMLRANCFADKEIKLSKIYSPETVYGCGPFKIDEEYYKTQHKINPENNVMTAYYPALATNSKEDVDKNFVFGLTGEKTDDYPFTIFEAEVARDTAPGEYSVNFYTGQDGYFSEVMYKFGALNSTLFKPSGSNAPSLYFNVSTHSLGDIDGDGSVDGSDATQALKAFAKAGSPDGNGLTVDQNMCADVDGDGSVDGSDATLVLKYYAYQMSGGKYSMNEMVSKILDGEELDVPVGK